MNIPRPLSKQPLPDTATRVYKGIIFDVYQWEVDGYDGTKKTFEKLKRPDTVIVIPITEDGKIILTKQEQPGKLSFLGTAGGRVDDGEDVLDAAKRELLEETGYEAKEWVLFDAVQPVSKVEWAVYTFFAKGCRKIGEQNLDGAEKIELLYLDFDDFVEKVLDKNFGDLELKIKFFEAKLEEGKLGEIRKMLLG
jgi:ADP-ribose pyrophosphatase